MEVRVHLYTQSEPVVIKDVHNAYQKGTMYCVMLRVGDEEIVYKFPTEHIFRVKEIRSTK